MSAVTTTLISGTIGFLKGAVGQKYLLNKHAANYKHTILVEIGKYSTAQIEYLSAIGYIVHEVEPLRSQPCKFAASRWPYTFTKLHIWDLPYDKVLYMDADAAPFSSIDELMSIDTNLGATPKREVSYRFRSGLLLIKPDKEIFKQLTEFLQQPAEVTHAKLGDQGILNVFFHNNFTTLSHHFHFVDWGWRLPPEIVVGHLRPKPWGKNLGLPRMRPYSKKWKAGYSLMIKRYGPLPQ